MRLKSGLAVFLAFVAATGLYNYTSALMTSGLYRIMISEQTTIGNSALKTGGAYSLLGSTGQLGQGSIGGGRYTIGWGTMNSWRTAQVDVSLSHPYPNPCKLSKGCNSVTFTHLTLRATILIYTVSGEKVRTIEKTGNLDSQGWDLRNETGARVASGLYLYVVKGDGRSKRGKLIIVR